MPVVAKVAAPKPVVVAARVPAVADDDGLAGLYELAEQADAAPMPVESVRCPQCTSDLEDDAVLCTQCGYNTRTGKALAGAVADQPPTLAYRRQAIVKKPVDLMAPQGAFVNGLILCGICALVTSTVWIGFEWWTQYPMSYLTSFISLLIGISSGAGMHIGQRGYSSAGGYTAAGMTLLAILFAKFVYIELLLQRQGFHRSIVQLDHTRVGYFFFNPVGMVIMGIGMAAAFRTANGSISD